MVDSKTIGIFIRSYDGDAKWLQRTLPIMVARARGYDDIAVVGIPDECLTVRQIAEDCGVRFVEDRLAGRIIDGYINQQYTKMRADLFMQTDYILYVDSDCVCTEEHAPDILFDDGLPVMLYSDWEHVGGRVGGGDASCWFEPTKNALGFEPAYEFMRKLPLLYPYEVVRGCRQHIELQHMTTLAKYLGRQNTFSEFNAIGAYAYAHHRDKFKWVCPETEGIPYNPWRQFWSHGDMDTQLAEIA